MPKKDGTNSITRPPIVVVMGHIDHGKTTLLDYIRKAKVAEGEAGGITQHVSAYEIRIKDHAITFLDTPGHEAFSKIRARGAKIADIAILVVASDDKVNTQTEEALQAIKDAQLPFVVAINKIDKTNANPELIKKQLAEKEIYLESLGGKIPSINISAKTGEGIDELLEMILLMADMEELKTDPSINASGFILESNVDKKRGVTATMIIQNGSLKQGMYVVSENSMAPVRIFENFLGKSIKEASAPSPIKITGWSKLPQAGGNFQTFISKKEAEQTIQSNRNAISFISQTISHFGSAQTDNIKKIMVPLIIKADALGSVEAIEKQIEKIKEENASFNLLRADVGDINEDDIKLASSGGNAMIIGFHVLCPNNMLMLAERYGVNIKLFEIIYEAEDWLKEELKKRAPLIETTEVIGKAKILKIFTDDKTKKIIGGEVTSGKIALTKQIKIYRRDFVLGEGKILELQHNKIKTNEVNEGEQFGALLQTKVVIAPHDILEIIGEKNAT